MPDQYESLHDNPLFSIRLANEGVWEENTGYNDLKATLTIDSSAPKDPGELPQGVEIVSNEPSVLSPQKRIEDGIFYILMPDGKRYYCF